MSNIPAVRQVDYTSRDYLSIRQDMIDMIRQRLPQWQAQDSDFGLALVEAFAYSVDTLNYMIDRIGNEAYLDTAVQRPTLHTLATMFGYTPNNGSPATVQLQFTNNSTSAITVPAGTRCQASVPQSAGGKQIIVYFETTEDLLVPPADPSTEEANSLTVDAIEGRTYRDETLGVSTGGIRQQYVLAHTSVIDDTLNIVTELTSNAETVYSSWEEVYSLRNEGGPNDQFYESSKQSDGSTLVVFGDNSNGRAPDLHSIIKVSYRVGGGTRGNVAAGAIDTIVDPVLIGLSVTNPAAATGGTDVESIDSIRKNAAGAFRSRKRAVTLDDYTSLALALPYVSKARTVGNNGSSVTVYVTPVPDGSAAPTPLPLTTLDSTRVYLEGLAMAGVTVTVLGPLYKPVYLTLTVHCKPSARQSVVAQGVRDALRSIIGYDVIDFGMILTQQQIMVALSEVDGIAYSVVDFLGEAPSGIGTNLSTINFDDESPNALPSLDVDDSTSLILNLVGGIV